MPAEARTRDIAALDAAAAQLRIDSVRATTEAGSGHPSSCASAADIAAALFFSVMRYDPKDPRNPANDAFILSKGHAAPLLYAAWARAGAFPPEELLKLRRIDSDLEGHPTPRLPFVDVATGSLGQGLSAGIGIALSARMEGGPQRVYVLLGDGESAEGSVWEAAHTAAYYKLANLCATVDINRLGQSQPTMEQHDIQAYEARWAAFGWKTFPVDGHDIGQLLDAYEQASRVTDRPSVVLARTVKGKGIPAMEGKAGQHGKPLGREEADETVRALEQRLGNGAPAQWSPAQMPQQRSARTRKPSGQFPAPPYQQGKDKVATRQAFGTALAALGAADPRVAALDGDVKNSTYTEEFEKQHADRFLQMYIAEQNMVGAAMGLAARGWVPFAATFACFLTRAYDFLRMAAISRSNIKLAGSHAGVSIGEDGPSQMGLEDLAMTCAEPNFTVLYPSDGVSAWYATKLAADVHGPVYIRTTRPKTPVLYKPDEKFEIGRAKTVRSSDRDRVTLVAAGVTLFEALKAADELAKEGVAVRVIDIFSVQPVDRETLREAALATGGLVVTVEDHYGHGGIGDAVLSALAADRVIVYKVAVDGIPRSGSPEELLDKYGLSASRIAAKVREILTAAGR